MPSLRLHLFGSPRVSLDGSEIRFDTRKAVALLAILAVTEREHSRDALAAMLWPELDRARARATLRRTLSVATAAGPALEVTASGIRLDAGQSWCDVSEFRRLTEAPDPQSWRAAADIALAGFLEGFALRDSPQFEDWRLATADALRDLLSQTLGGLVSAAVEAGDLAAALGYARRRTQVEPLSEPAHADLIRVTAWTGDRPGALSAYRSLVRLLDRELGVAPLPETLALNQAIRAGALALPAPRTPAPRTPAPPRAPNAPEYRATPELEGRAKELARLDAAWLMPSGALGVVGEPGMGKTALLTVFAARIARDDPAVLRLSGHESERSLAYAAANDLVRGILALAPDLVARLGSASDPLGVLASEVEADDARAIRNPGDLRRLHEAVRDALATVASGRRVVVVIDDADALDAPSAALFAYLVRRLPEGVLLLASWVPGQGGGHVAEAIAEAGSIFVLPPLDVAAVEALVKSTSHSADEVHRRTRGIPMLVLEYAAPRSDELAPTDVRDVVTARFEGASATTRQVVGAAAVIGTVADPELLRVACGRDEGETVDAIEEAITRGLLVERVDRPGYDVPHEVVRDVALAHLSLARIRLLHGRVADLLARRHAVDPMATPAGAVARHLSDAGRDQDAGVWFVRAAEDASRLYAHAEALDQLRAASASGYRPLEVHEGIGMSLVRLGRYADALVSLDRAGALAEDDPPRQAAIEHAIAGVYDRLGDPVLAQSHLEAARDLAGEDPHGRAGRILADLALVQHRRGDTSGAERTASDAIRLADGSGDESAVAQAENVLGVVATAQGAHASAVTQLTAAAARARRLGDLDLLIAALNNLSRAYQANGSEDEALDAAREALEWAERQGDRHRLAALHSHLADLLHAVGRDEEAVAELKMSASAFAELQEAQTRPEVWTLTEW